MFQKATAKIHHTLLRYFSVCFVRFHFCIKGKKWGRLKVESLKSKVEGQRAEVEGRVSNLLYFVFGSFSCCLCHAERSEASENVCLTIFMLTYSVPSYHQDDRDSINL